MNEFFAYDTPEELGISSRAITRFLKTVQQQKLGLHSAILLRHGKVALECYVKPYVKGNVHILYSLSKSFTSTAIGFAVQEGLLSLSDTIVSFFPEKLPCAPCGYMQQVTVENLLCMASGHSEEPPALSGKDWVYNFLTSYIDREPGSLFTYNTAGTFMLSAILQKVTGMTVFQYLKPRLFDPLDFSSDTCWDQSPDGIDCGGYGLNITTRDLAKFGQFLLQRGMWEGKQLLNAAWIDLATAKHIDNYGELDWGCGYGFQFWRCQPEGVYRGDGAFGQYCIVMPKQDAVLAINASTGGNLQAMPNAIWEHLLAAMQDQPLPQDIGAQYELQCLCESLKLPTEIEGPTGRTDVNGIFYRLSDNPAKITGFRAAFGEQRDTLYFTYPQGTFTCTIHHGDFSLSFLPTEDIALKSMAQNDPKQWDQANKNNAYVESIYCRVYTAGGWTGDAYRLYLFGMHDTRTDCIELKFSHDRRAIKMHYRHTNEFDAFDATVYGVAEF